MDVIVGAFKNAEKLLRKGGALLVDHRNFLPAILNGKMNRNGFSPCIHVSNNKRKPFVQKKKHSIIAVIGQHLHLKYLLL